ncbi:hypothetical protein [Pseudoalteromonas luteoviolacea]|uniref:Uncharacterized protein n=1 Tax=Pseudoalteromonas luteoviolacea S4060-1 TaxID=1365257 RepID=A0A167JBF7_9GAMM|nr:hypothetical protein [Pseudoalteromonas luteoviolacea]KZN60863.1 hypothetical protein N478_26005 [Pseudoalteromonas luteoviolacea S4060-1]
MIWWYSGMTDLNEEKVKLIQNLKSDMMSQYGPLIGGNALYKVLGYKSKDALRQAICRNTAPVKIFSIEKRRGKFALTQDVAVWLAMQKLQITPNVK